jgi:hypothetical protein
MQKKKTKTNVFTKNTYVLAVFNYFFIEFLDLK